MHSMIVDHDESQASYFPTPPDSRPISPHHTQLISHDLKGSFREVAAYPKSHSLELLGKSERTLTSSSCGSSDRFLVVSPYNSRPHLLKLTDLDNTSQLLAKALTVMRHVRDDYATTPYSDAFNWQEIVQHLRKIANPQKNEQWHENKFYIVVFRSRVASGTDPSYLGHLDELSHAEAMKTGGLLKYWFGRPNDERRNLATCEFLRLFRLEL